MSEFLQLKIEDASLEKIAESALKAIEPNDSADKKDDIKDVSGYSGSKTYIVLSTKFQSA